MAERTIQCLTCGKQFTHIGGNGRPPKHCSAKCGRKKLLSGRRHDRPEECEGCGDKRGLFGGLCDECRPVQAQIMRHAYRRRDRGRDHLPPHLVAYVGRAERQASSPLNKDHQCAVCGATFRPKEANRTTVCSRECGFIHRAREVKACFGLSEDSPNHRDRIKPRRRVETHGGRYEHVNPSKVFDRDGWRCGLCGRMTRPDKRGTNDPRAPELDHILPVSKGGDHTYANTQCACRACNIAKGATPKGQLLLFPMG